MKKKQFTIQYLSAFLTGFVSFIVLVILRLSYDNETYSRSSLIILLFPIYQACQDLGTHQQFLASPVSFSVLFRTRLVFSVIALFLALGHGFLAGFSTESFLSLVLLVLNFVPLSFLSSLDTYAFANDAAEKAVLFRLARTSGLIVFAAVSFFFPKFGLLLPYASLLVSSFIISFVFYRKYKPLIGYSGKIIEFINASMPIGSTQLLVAGHMALLWASLVRTVDETSLSPLGEVVTLSTPIALCFQTVLQIFMPSLVKNDRQKVHGVLFLIYLASVFGTFVLFKTKEFYPILNERSLSFFIFLGLSLSYNYFLSVSFIYFLTLQTEGRKKLVFILYFFLALSSFLPWILFSKSWGHYFIYLFGFSFFWMLTGKLTLMWFGQKRPYVA